jgi:hypothetical protein
MYSQTTHPTLPCCRQQRRHSHHEQRAQPSTQQHRKARRIVRDNIDTIDHYPDDRVIQKTNWHTIYQDADVEPGGVWWYW